MTANSVVATKSGLLQGTFENSVYVFKGIPYAAPPTGERRWLPPQPPLPWAGVRLADKFGPIAPQPAPEFQAPREVLPAELQDEDCLFLNIWTPGLDDKKRAVMVWIHGGAYSLGSGSEPNQPNRHTLALRGNVVLMTINYRLGPLGFLNLKELTGGQIPATGNEGLLDQAAALRWVGENITAFGGDPANVTVFGESAGAMSVGALLALPAARGLFGKAIMQSGACTCHSLEDAVKEADKLIKALGLSGRDADKLRRVPAQTLIETQHTMWAWKIRGAPVEPVIDGQVLPVLPLDAVQAGSARGIAVMAGSNLDEGTLFYGVEPRIVQQNEDDLRRRTARIVPEQYVANLVEAYREALAERWDRPPTPGEIYVAISGDSQFRMPGLRMVAAQQKLGTPAYSYLFDYVGTAVDLGSCHSLDVGFVFGSTNREFHGTGPAVDRLTLQMQEAWTAFARTGRPTCSSLGDWPEYNPQRRTMILGQYSRVAEAPYETERRAWDKIENKWLG